MVMKRESKMSQIDASYQRLLKRFVEWAGACPDIRGAVIVGSRARVEHPADEWADLDIVIITTYPERYLSTTDWIENIGNALLTFVEPTATGGEMERRVLFEGMLDVDFAIIPEKNVQMLLQDTIPPQIVAQMVNTIGRGVRVLLDKDGLVTQFLSRISSIEIPPPCPPTQQEFLEVVNDFLYHVVFTAKHLRRGELWWAKMCCDCHMQRLLLRMIEWHARATHGWNYDTWFRGRFLEEWADPRVLEGLRKAFAQYDENDVRRASLATIDLFHLLATETAEKLSHKYPSEADWRVTEWVNKILSTRTSSKREENSEESSSFTCN
nr:aminoglycoside 6-adenylyltransferase [Candidatus Njordarchaeum guaymaensis]